MDERVMHFRVGVMVVASLLILAILVALIGEFPSPWRRKRILHVYFPEAPGVSQGTPVFKSGIRIGQVTAVRFDETDADNDPNTSLIVSMKVDDDKPVYTNEDCFVAASLLGDASLKFVRSPDKPLTQDRYPDGAPLTGRVSEDPIAALGDLKVGLSGAFNSVSEASSALRTTVENVNELISANKQNITEAADQAADTLKAVEEVCLRVDRLVGDPEELREPLKEALDQMPQTLTETRATIAKMQQTMGSLERNLRNIEQFTEPLGERGDVVIDRLDAGSQKLELLMDEMLTFTRALNNPQGTVGQLIHNPELYQHMNRAVQNVEQLTRQLQPIVADARVFSDKIARHPGIIVRDAVRPGSGVK